MTLHTSFHALVFWLHSHPIATAFCVLIVLYKVYTWLFPDPMMKLPLAPGGSLCGGHSLIVTEWVYVTQSLSKLRNLLSSSARRTPSLHEKYAKELGRNIRLRGFHPVRRYPGVCSSEIDL